MSDGSWPDVRKPSVTSDTNKLTSVRPHLNENDRRPSDTGVDMSDVGNQQCLRRKVDECFGQTIQITCETAFESSVATTNVSTLSTMASGSSTSGQTRLPTSLLFELPANSRRGSTSCSDERMPAISKAQMKGEF